MSEPQAVAGTGDHEKLSTPHSPVPGRQEGSCTQPMEARGDPLLPEPHTHHSPAMAAQPDPGQTWYLREGKCHQGPTDHDEVQNIPQVPEVGPRVQQKSQINHLQGRNTY